MQVTETSAEGLKRELRVVVGAGELGERFASRLNEIKDRVQLKGFRPGKVPVAHIKRVYGRSMMAEVVQQAVSETSQKALEERQERPAFRPDIKFSEDTAEIERVLGGEADLAYSMSFEVLPKVEIADLSKVAIERPVATVGDAQVDKTLGDMIESNVRFEPVEGRAATDGDRVSVDFTGKIDGTPFEGGVGEAVNVVIGKGGFIPGFEEGLVGAKAGDSRVVTATFPEAYPVKELAGKAAEFDVTVKSVDKPVKSSLDDDFAKQLGFEDLGKLREAVSHDLERDFARASRMKAKRALLDVLDAQHAFALPPTLVENEFEQMWREVNEGLQRAGRTFEDEGKTEAGERESYRKLAERRVRLGLVLSEIGQANKITVSDEELSRALSDQVRRFPGQEAEVYSFYRKNPQALAQLRAPIYEEKVVTFILEMAKVTDKTVSAEELFAGDDDEDEHAGHDHHGHAHHHHDHDHAHDHDHDHDHAHDHDHGHAHGHGHEHRK